MATPVVPDTEENADRCLCPTYNECMTYKDERIYCSRGNTECKFDAEGCLCGECPVWKEYMIKSFYYCKNPLIL